MTKLPFLLCVTVSMAAGLRADPLVDDAFARVVAPGAKVVKLADQFSQADGPVWNPRGFWVFSDTKENSLFKITPAGQVALLRHPSGNSNGNAYDTKGRLVSCEHNRRLTRKTAAGSFETLADRCAGKRLNSPNDLAIRSDGSIYFTDPTLGGTPDVAIELTYHGLYRLPPKGALELLDVDWSQPNGLAFSPDEKTLYVGDSDSGKIFRYDVAAAGTLTNKTLLATIPKPGGPDGMKTDAQGRLYVAGPGGIWIFAARGGLLGKIPVPKAPSNLAFGGADGKTLLITAHTTIYSVKLKEGDGRKR